MSYRLVMKMVGSETSLLGLVGLDAIDEIKDVITGLRGESPIEFELHLGTKKLRDVHEIAEALSGVHLTVMKVLRDELREQGFITAGPLKLAAKELVWGKNDPLTVDEVESIELFDDSPLVLRVMKHGKVWPYGKVKTVEVPDLIEVMELARELGYPVRGIELLNALRSAVA